MKMIEQRLAAKKVVVRKRGEEIAAKLADQNAGKTKKKISLVLLFSDKRGWILLVLNLLVFQFITLRNYEHKRLKSSITTHNTNNKENLLRSSKEDFVRGKRTTQQQEEETTTTSTNILAIPAGKAVALPSIRIGQRVQEERYGGKGDKGHLGGFTDLDHMGISPNVWKWMIRSIGIKSLLDVGCGRGISTSWFYDHGVTDVLCVEGSHDAVEQSVLPHPQSQMVEHDFSRGPWYPPRTFDAVWCVEFLEHVGRNLQKNYVSVFRKSALLFLSHSNWGGHHHVEVHKNQFWINKFSMFGFVYSDVLTKRVRRLAMIENGNGIAPNGVLLNAQHVWLTMMVFINPAVSALPEHSHLFTESGCFNEGLSDEQFNQKCLSKEERLNLNMYDPITITPQQDEVWFQRVKSHVVQKTASKKDQIKIDRILRKNNGLTMTAPTNIPEYEKLFGPRDNTWTKKMDELYRIKDAEYFNRTREGKNNQLSVKI